MSFVVSEFAKCTIDVYILYLSSIRFFNVWFFKNEDLQLLTDIEYNKV